MNTVLGILYENATTFKEREAVTGLLENERTDVTNKMLTDLYQSTINRADIDFDTIPDSKGNVLKYSGYTKMDSVLTLIEEMSVAQNVKVPEVLVVRETLNSLVRMDTQFERGFALDKDILILTYNTIVHACVVSTSEIISSYVEFIKSPDQLEFKLLKAPDRQGISMVSNLERFNAIVKSGEFTKMSSGIIKTDANQLIGLDDFFIPAIVVGGALTIIPLIRELIFGFYYSRMKTSEYLAQQSALLEINKAAIESSGRTMKDKRAIIKRQEKVAHRLDMLSDKVSVQSKMSKKEATVNMKKEESKWRIEPVKQEVETSKVASGGFSLL